MCIFKVQDSKGTGTGTDDLYEPTLWYYDLLLFTSQSECGRKGRAIDEDEVESVSVLERNNYKSSWLSQFIL